MSRVEVLHGVNLDTLGRRDPALYGSFTLAELEARVKGFGDELDLETSFAQTNHEGEYCELVHRAGESAHGLVLNPGAWTHYSYAIRDALEVAALPAVEVHISRVDDREEWRRRSVIADLCVGRVQGRGVDGYREALEILHGTLGG
ncbi:MAG: 3-dehydroquinate dehydratase [Thermoleophilaceae bacterium]|nr:3-dehydroquinate dehydratase [Thermoleophilaceae bacterium]